MPFGKAMYNRKHKELTALYDVKHLTEKIYIHVTLEYKTEWDNRWSSRGHTMVKVQAGAGNNLRFMVATLNQLLKMLEVKNN